MGIKVPDGFVVTTNAFNAFMKANNLGMQIAQKVKLVTDADDFDQIEIVSKEIRNLFEVSEIPEELCHDIKSAYQELSFKCSDINLPTAVRSSATGEDSADSSFAGQFDT